MKKLSLVLLAAVVCSLIGCESKELVLCREDNQTLQAKVNSMQADLDEANNNVAAKDQKIEDMKAENTEMQTKAMQSIQTMMTKQSERDAVIKQQLADKTEQVAELQKQVKTLQSQLKDTIDSKADEIAALQSVIKDLQAKLKAATPTDSAQ